MNSISIKNYNTVLWQVSHKNWEEFINVLVMTKSWPDNPWINIFIPSFDSFQPFLKNFLKLTLFKCMILFQLKNWMHCQIWRIWLDCRSWWFWAKYMCQISSNSEWGHSWIIRRSWKLIASSDNPNLSILSFLGIFIQRWENWLDSCK